MNTFFLNIVETLIKKIGTCDVTKGKNVLILDVIADIRQQRGMPFMKYQTNRQTWSPSASLVLKSITFDIPMPKKSNQ